MQAEFICKNNTNKVETNGLKIREFEAITRVFCFF